MAAVPTSATNAEALVCYHLIQHWRQKRSLTPSLVSPRPTLMGACHKHAQSVRFRPIRIAEIGPLRWHIPHRVGRESPTGQPINQCSRFWSKGRMFQLLLNYDRRAETARQTHLLSLKLLAGRIRLGGALPSTLRRPLQLLREPADGVFGDLFPYGTVARAGRYAKETGETIGKFPTGICWSVAATF